MDADYLLALKMVKSARCMLRRIWYMERYSGIRRSVIASLLGGGVSQCSASRILKVDLNKLVHQFINTFNNVSFLITHMMNGAPFDFWYILTTLRFLGRVFMLQLFFVLGGQLEKFFNLTATIEHHSFVIMCLNGYTIIPHHLAILAMLSTSNTITKLLPM